MITTLGRWCGQLEDHAEAGTAFGQAGAKGGLVETVGLTKLHPDEEARRQPVVERMVLGDIAALLEQVARDRVHRAQNAWAIGGEDPGIRGTAHG